MEYSADVDEVIDTLWEAHHRVGLWTVPVRGAVDVVREDSTLHVTIQYIVRRTQEQRVAEFKQD